MYSGWKWGWKSCTAILTKLLTVLNVPASCLLQETILRQEFPNTLPHTFLSYCVLLILFCTPPCPLIISLIANWLIPILTSALPQRWCSMVQCSYTAEVIWVISTRKKPETTQFCSNLPLNHIYKLSFLIYPSVYFSCKEAEKRMNLKQVLHSLQI